MQKPALKRSRNPLMSQSIQMTPCLLRAFIKISHFSPKKTKAQKSNLKIKFSIFPKPMYPKSTPQTHSSKQSETQYLTETSVNTRNKAYITSPQIKKFKIRPKGLSKKTEKKNNSNIFFLKKRRNSKSAQYTRYHNLQKAYCRRVKERRSRVKYEM